MIRNFSEFKLMLNFHGRNILSILVINCQTVLESYWKPERRYIKPLLLHYTIHLLIRIWYIVILCGETPILPIWKKSIFCRKKKLVRIIISSPYRAHTAPLLLANRLLSVTEINSYMVGIFMYNYIHGILPNTFSEYFERNRNVHQCNTRQADDLRVPFERLNVRIFSIKIHGAHVWNSLLQYINLPHQ